MSVAAARGLDLNRLEAWLGCAPLEAERIEGGYSNLTYRLKLPGNRSDWVLRMPPPGPAARAAHDMAREHRVTSALRGTNVPVPRPIALCDDPQVIGAPFWISEFVAGATFRDQASLTKLGPGPIAAVMWSLADTLSALHTVVPDEVGLAGFGRPEGFLDRQLDIWRRLGDSAPSPDFDALHARLRRAMPAFREPALLHGDYRLDNVLVRNAEVVAVLDWEMAALGDPLTDLGLLVAHIERRDDVLPNPAGAPGFPSSAEIVRRYALHSGLDVSSIGWYAALGFLKFAAIACDVHRRYLTGSAAGAGFAGFDRVAASAAAQGNALLKEW